MDELVDELDPRLGYGRQNAFLISIMAFADNLVLIRESLTGIESLLKKTETIMSRRGIKIKFKQSYDLPLDLLQYRRENSAEYLYS